MFCPECATEEGTPHKEGCHVGKAEAILLRDRDKPFVKEDAAPNDYSNGDCYDEDTGEYLGSFELNVEEKEEDAKESLPVQISMFYDGYWYIYKPMERHKHKPETSSNDEIAGRQIP